MYTVTIELTKCNSFNLDQYIGLVSTFSSNKNYNKVAQSDFRAPGMFED